MNFSWTPHRFSGGALALDVANSVILRFDKARRTDRFAVAEQLEDFARAATELCAEKEAFTALAPVTPEDTGRLMALRECIDRFFRLRVETKQEASGHLADLLDAISAVIRRHEPAPVPCPLDLATARSALGLLCMPEPERMKICPNCEWLFVDRSRNRSRNWCDMSVCGNRAKARLHYQRKRKDDRE